MLIFRRFLVLLALLFWQGGFTFYASVVVPVAQEELGHRRQGFVTRRVTNFLNLATAVGLVILAWDDWTCRDPKRLRRRLRVATWMVMAATLVGLVWLHGRLEDFLDPDTRLVFQPAAFHGLHRLYLWVSTVQWAGALVYLFLLLRAWRAEDGNGTFQGENVVVGELEFMKEEGTKKVPPLTPSASPSHRSHHAAEQK
jgi:hypothetical protein